MNGTYRHYKGKTYNVLGRAEHTETNVTLVIYLDEEGRVWARPYDMFMEEVEVNGEMVARFKRVE